MTATPAYPGRAVPPGAGGSIGTRYATEREAFRALVDFDRTESAPSHIEMIHAVTRYRKRHGIEAGRRFVCPV